MAVHGCYIVQDGVNKQVSAAGNWGSCWAFFSESYRFDELYVPGGPEAEIHILAKLERQQHPVVEAMVASNWFKRLTQGKVWISRFAPGNFGNHRLTAAQMNPEGYVHITAMAGLDTSRFITAMRLITILRNTNDLSANVPRDKWWMIPLVHNAKSISGEAYSDGWITLAPITAKDISDYYDEYKDQNDWDDEGDMYFSEATQQIMTDKNPSGALVSVEMLQRIFDRTDEQFDQLTFQRGSVLSEGYYKDEDYHEWVNATGRPDDVVTIGAPLTDLMHAGETQIYDHQTCATIIDLLK